MLEEITRPLLPVAFVILLGYLAGARGKLNQSDSVLISRLVLNWIFPALLLVGMAKTPRAQLLDIRFVTATFIGIMGMYAVAFVIGWYRHRELKVAALKGLVCGYPDAAFMGIPILASMFGPNSLYPVLVLNVIASLVMMPLTTTLLAIASGKQSGAQAFVSSIWEAIRRPIMWAPAIGIAVSVIGIKLPAVAADSLELLGKATPGVSLFCLGLIMSSVKLKPSLDVWGNLGLKLLMHPALMVGALYRPLGFRPSRAADDPALRAAVCDDLGDVRQRGGDIPERGDDVDPRQHGAVAHHLLRRDLSDRWRSRRLIGARHEAQERRVIMATVADQFAEVLAAAGVKRIYGIVGDSLIGITDAIRRQGKIEWLHVRHEEVAAFAAGAEAHLTGTLAVCAGSCGPGNLHLINGLFDCHRSRVPVLAIAAHIPSAEIGSGYFQETHPENLFKECSHYCELVSSAAADAARARDGHPRSGR